MSSREAAIDRSEPERGQVDKEDWACLAYPPALAPRTRRMYSTHRTRRPCSPSPLAFAAVALGGLVGTGCPSVHQVVPQVAQQVKSHPVPPAPASGPLEAPRRSTLVPIRYQLDNGLTVVLEENHATPVVAFQAWVTVGSADEPEELAGIAHVFEHMLFKGTAKRGVGQIAQEVEAAGGDINAWTSFDQTVYHLVLASRYFDTGLDILSDALQNSSFDPGELQRELKVVLEEVKQGEDSPGRMASQALFSTAYARHPYRRPVIGYTKTVEKFERRALLDFFGRHYVPKNATLVVVGDFDVEKARKKIAQSWGAWGKAGARAPAATVRPVDPPQRAPRFVVTGADVKETHLAIAFHVPGLRHADTAPLDLAAIILGQGDSSRLQIEVKRNRQVVSDAYAYAYTPKDPGLLVAGATLPPAQVDEAAQAILDQLFRLIHLEVTPEELDKAKAIIESDSVYQKETVQGLARKLGFYSTVGESLHYEDEYNRSVRAVTPATLRAVAAKYLRPENCTISLLVPEAEAKKEKRAEARMREQLAGSWARAEQVEKALPKASGEVLLEVLPNGARLLVRREATIPLVAMRAVWVGGLRTEDERSNGINNMVAALVTRGTKTRTGDELAHEVESMAGSIGGFSGRNSFGLRAEMLARNVERGLAILADCILNPAFSDGELEKERRQVLEELRTQEDNVSSVAFRLFGQALYPNHPYRLDILGSPASVAGITRKKIVDHYRQNFPTSQMTLAIVGDVDPARIVAQVRALFDQPAPKVAAAAAIPAPAFPKAPVQVIKLLNKQQAHLVLGFPGTTVADPDRFPLEVLSTILSGQGGRLFVELRDKRGLAYRVSAFSLEGVDPGYFAVYMATSPENLAVAEAGIRDELNKVIDRPVGREELSRAKRYLVGAHDISLQRRAALASTLAFHEAYGLGWDEYRRYAPAIHAVSAADVQRVARTYLDPQRAVLAVVKPEEVSPTIAKKRAVETARREKAEAAVAARAEAARKIHGAARGKTRGKVARRR
ncbi:MAG: insulinase family protein [Myxococcales bacterium]|nr:insulinase family protein [Myxococcales bacterium]